MHGRGEDEPLDPLLQQALDGLALEIGIPLRGGDQQDLEIDVLLPAGGAAELTLCATPDGAEATVLELGRRDEGGATVDVRLDRSRSSADERTRRSDRQGSVPVGDDGRVRVRVLVDHSALEIFCNGQPLSARIYPTRDDALA